MRSVDPKVISIARRFADGSIQPDEFYRLPRSLRRQLWLTIWRPQGLPWTPKPTRQHPSKYNRANRRRMASVFGFSRPRLLQKGLPA